MSKNGFRNLFSQFYVAYLVILIGVMAGVGVFWYQKSVQRDRLTLRFQEMTDSPVKIIGQRLSKELERLEEVRDTLELISGKGPVNRLTPYIHRLLNDRNPSKMVLVELASRSSELNLTHISRDVPFRVYPGRASEDFEKSILRTRSVRRAMQRVFSGNEGPIVLPARSVDRRYDPSEFMIFHRVNTLEIPSRELEDAQPSRGMMMMVYDLESVINQAVEPLKTKVKRHFRMEITHSGVSDDLSDPRREQRDTAPIAKSAPEPTSPVKESYLGYSTRIDFANQELRLRFSPTDYFFKRYENNTPILTASLVVLVFFVIGLYLYQQTKLNRRIRRMAEEDELTGLYDRRFFMETFQNELEQARRYNHPLSLLILDVDHFKEVNDTHGHQTGDEVLEQLGSILRREIRESDIPARYGGEEFAVVLPETSLNEARKLAERIRETVAEHTFRTSSGALEVTVSVGVSALHESAQDVDDLVRDADDALYQSKKAGRDRVTVGVEAEP